MLQSSVLNRVRERLERERLPVSVRLWNQQTVSGADPALITLCLNSPRALSLFAKPSLGKLAAGYVEQLIDVQGNIRDAVRLLAPLFASGPRVQRKLNDAWRFWRHTRSRDRRAVSSHYDVSNEFYALWLDRHRVYSCAYFKTPDDSLDLAQEQKLEHICRKLCLQPGERLLDIGCGWGGLIMWAAQRYGVRATGITVSRNQYEYVRREIQERGLAERCEIKLMDYRDVPESEPFDKVVSVGMFEHVGVRMLPAYFRKIHSLLKPGGVVMNHGITSSTFDGETISTGGHDFIARYVFPDGELTHVSKVIEILSRQGLECLDAEGLRPHYARTLWHWVERLDARQEEARALVGEEKYRVWRAYMAGFAFAFEQGWESIYQILAVKPRTDGSTGYPLTREHIYR